MPNRGSPECNDPAKGFADHRAYQIRRKFPCRGAPTQKSYCMSTTRSTSFSLVCMGTSLGKGSGASFESWKPVYNDINGNGTHDIRQFPLILKYRPEGSALQFINYGWRNATREIDAPASLQCHGRIAGNSRQPRDKMVQGFF